MRPPPSPKIHNKKNGAEEQLAIFFFQCDEYRTGQVKAQRLLGLLRELAQEDVEIKQVEHLARILDPHNDDRALDLQQWLRAGTSWLSSLAGMETDAVRAGRLQPGCVLEGIGGGSGLSSGREVELELKLQEVEFTAARLGKELEEALGAQMVSEEQVVLLEQELKRRNEMVSDLKEQIGQYSLIKEEVKCKENDESLRQLEEDLQTTKQKLRTGGEREIVLEGRLASEERKCKMLEEELLVNDKLLKEGKNMKDEVERQLGELRREVQLGELR